MKFGLDKCRNLNMDRRRTPLGSYDMQNDRTIEAMGEGGLYKYIAVILVRRIDHQMELTNEFVEGLCQVVRTNLFVKTSRLFNKTLEASVLRPLIQIIIVHLFILIE